MGKLRVEWITDCTDLQKASVQLVWAHPNHRMCTGGIRANAIQFDVQVAYQYATGGMDIEIQFIYQSVNLQSHSVSTVGIIV